MARLKKGMTLLELVIAMLLLTMVLTTASALLISFQKFYSGFMKKQENVSDVSLAALEEIVGKATVANSIVALNGSWPVPLPGNPTGPSIVIIDNGKSSSPTNTSDDQIMELVWDQSNNKLILGYLAPDCGPGVSTFMSSVVALQGQSEASMWTPSPCTLFTHVTYADFTYDQGVYPGSKYWFLTANVNTSIPTLPSYPYTNHHISARVFISSPANVTVYNNSYPNTSSIVITVDEPNTPAIPGDDVTYTYWLDADSMKRTISTTPGEQIIAKNITALNFGVAPPNELTISVTTKTAEGSSDTFTTSVVARGCAAVKVI